MKRPVLTLAAFFVLGCVAPCSATAAGASLADSTLELLDASTYQVSENADLLHAGYAGNTAAMPQLSHHHLSIYAAGAAAAGHTELVCQCLENGAVPNYIIVGAARGGHRELVRLLLSKGADPTWGIEAAALGAMCRLWSYC